MKTMAKRILERTGFRRLLIVNAFIGAGFVAANGFFTPETPHWLIMIVLLVGGCFRSLQFTSLNAIGYAEISNREMSYATSLSSALQQVSLSIGVAFGAFVLEAAASLDGNPVITAVAMVSALAGFVFVGLSPTAGAEMSGHRIVKEKPPSTGLGDGMSGR
jgi:predicted MFS family arabinose efflux permease